MDVNVCNLIKILSKYPGNYPVRIILPNGYSSKIADVIYDDEPYCIFIQTEKEAAQGIAKSSAQQTEGRLVEAEQNYSGGLPPLDQNPPNGGLRPSA